MRYLLPKSVLQGTEGFGCEVIRKAKDRYLCLRCGRVLREFLTLQMGLRGRQAFFQIEPV